MENISKKIGIGISYLFRAFLAYVYIPHGYEKLTMTIVRGYTKSTAYLGAF